MVANVIGRDHGARSERMLYFKIPLHILRILEVAADVIQVWNGKGALRGEATALLHRVARFTPLPGNAVDPGGAKSNATLPVGTSNKFTCGKFVSNRLKRPPGKRSVN